MSKPDFCICENNYLCRKNKCADQLHGSHTADQHLCFPYIVQSLLKSEISSHQPTSVAVQPGLCWTRSETSKTGFLVTRLISLTLLVPVVSEMKFKF